MCALSSPAVNPRITDTVLLSRLAVKPGRAVVVVTHDSRVFGFADRIAHMDDGRIQSVTQGRPAAAKVLEAVS